MFGTTASVALSTVALDNLVEILEQKALISWNLL